jgi:hypothetical protein
VLSEEAQRALMDDVNGVDSTHEDYAEVSHHCSFCASMFGLWPHIACQQVGSVCHTHHAAAMTVAADAEASL